MRKVMNLNLPFAQYHFAEAKGTQKRRRLSEIFVL